MGDDEITLPTSEDSPIGRALTALQVQTQNAQQRLNDIANPKSDAERNNKHQQLLASLSANPALRPYVREMLVEALATNDSFARWIAGAGELLFVVLGDQKAIETDAEMLRQKLAQEAKAKEGNTFPRLEGETTIDWSLRVAEMRRERAKNGGIV